MTAVTTTPAIFCPECGYDLQGITSERCPECGKEYDRATMAESTIPWVHRKRIGRFRAYLRTVLLATFWPARLGEQVKAPQSFRDAKRFRLITSLIAGVPVAAVIVLAIIADGGFHKIDVDASDAFSGRLWTAKRSFYQDHIHNITIPLETGLKLWPVIPAMTLLCVYMLTGVASYAFHGRHLPVIQQNRSVAISYYTSGPFLFLGVFTTIAACVVAIMAKRSGWGYEPRSVIFYITGIFSFIAIAGSAITIVWTWAAMLKTLAKATRPGFGVMVAAVAVPGLAALATLLCFLFIPFLIGYACLIIESFR